MSMFGKSLDGSSPPTMGESVDLSVTGGTYQPTQIPAWIHVFDPMTVVFTPYAADETNPVEITVEVTSTMVPYILPCVVRRFSATTAGGAVPVGGIIATWWRKRQ